MSPEWVAAITVIAVQLLTSAVIFGSMQAQIKNNTKAIDELKAEQDNQWKYINANTEDVAYLNGLQGVSSHTKGAGGH